MRGKIVIDLTHPRLSRDGDISNEWLAMGTGEAMFQYLPGTRFVKAFNTVGPGHFENPLVAGVPIASDDAEAAEVAAALVRDVGLDPVFVGPLSRAKEFDRDVDLGDLRVRSGYPRGARAAVEHRAHGWWHSCQRVANAL
jgi:predicted dinucleotide-binding enzyme